MELNIVLVTGMSGAGKSTCMSILEDMGYYCIDQFPVQLIDSFAKLLQKKEDPRYSNLALATSAMDYPAFLKCFEHFGLKVRILFLDASNEKLLQRYKFTRRHHPFLIFQKANTLEEAIEKERTLFDELRERANIHHIDTTKLTSTELSASVEEHLRLGNKPSFAISFVSFGYKNGVPMDSDLLFDVRFLPNPYYIPELKKQSGDDKPVYDYVMSFEETKVAIEKITNFLDYVFPQYFEEGKTHVTVGIGCTGGQHRSVTITNYLYDLYSKKYMCYKSHRDKVKQ